MSESGGACKSTRYGGEGKQTRAMEKVFVLGSTPTLEVRSETNFKDEGETNCKGKGDINCRDKGVTNYKDEGETNCEDEGEMNCKDEGEGERRDPLEIVGVDIFQSRILPRLDARSLARSAAVHSRWRPFALADSLWQPLVEAFLAQRAHLPLCLMGRDFSTSTKQHLLYTIAVTESRQKALVAAEMCRRTWELRLKPPSGPYWLAFDPTQAGQPGLNRYFSCDGRLNSDPGDPIWGGYGCVWEFTRLEDNGHGPTELGVRINHWPPLAPRRVKDGRWVLENFYGLYITRADNPAFAPSDIPCHKFASSERRRWCRNACSPPTYGFHF